MYTPAYHPYTLPENAPQCVFELSSLNRDKSLQVKACSAVTSATSSFCPKHSYVLEVLKRGAALGYPEVQVNAFLWIGADIASWEAYALRHPLCRRRNIYNRDFSKVTSTVTVESHLELISKLDARIQAINDQFEAERIEALHNAGYSGAGGRETEQADEPERYYVPF